MHDLRLDDFCSWLVAHENELVGHPRLCFHSPLALWLSDKFGCTFGVDDRWYGWALSPSEYWRLLPRWAALFSSWLETVAASSLTGLQAIDLLARVELALWSPVA